MKTQKFLHIRIPHDFQQQLVKYAEDRFIPVSGVVLNSVAQTIGYKPQKAAPRNYSDPTAVVQQSSAVEPEYGELRPEDFNVPDVETDPEWEALQRRAAAAPFKPL